MTRRRLTSLARWTTTAAAGAIAVVALMATPATPAWAHTELVGSDPARDSTVDKAVTTVTLTFTEPVKQQFTTVNVLGPDASAYSTGDARSVDNNVLQTVRPLPAGAIRVTWRTVAADGDTIQGEFTFTNAYVVPAGSTPAPATTVAESTGPAAPGSSAAAASGATNADGGSSIWLVVGAVVAIVVVTGLWLWRRRRNDPAA